jgi:hypothetical protein
MVKKFAGYGLLVCVLMATGGCLLESTLDAKGGGVMTFSYPLPKKEDFVSFQKQLQSPAVKLTSAEFVEGEKSHGNFKIQFDDVTQISTAQFFSDVTVTRADGPKKGTKSLTAKIKHKNPAKMPEKVLEPYGKEVKVVVTLPGTVVDSNGKVSGGNTITWTWDTGEFNATPEVVMTATYQAAAAQ